jgi:ligand-binding sensor domain-containing protein
MNKLVIALWVLGLTVSVYAEEAVWESVGGRMTEVRAVIQQPQEPKVLFAGTANGLYKCEDSGKNWDAVVAVNGQCHGVNYLQFSAQDPDLLYAACGNGLYLSRNRGKDWKRIFKGKNASENSCLTLAVLSDALYLGTEAGLFISKDGARTWRKARGKLGKGSVLAIAWDPKDADSIYVASVEGIFKGRIRSDYWEVIFTASPAEGEIDIEEAAQDSDAQRQCSRIRYVCIDPVRVNHLYAATSGGMYQSRDRGETWQSLTGYGLLNQDVRFLMVSNSYGLYVAAKGGVFVYRGQQWEELSLGLTATRVNFLMQDSAGSFYAACDNGLFRTSSEPIGLKAGKARIADYFEDEPDIQKVQQKAIEYAEVEPEKIARWRSQAAKKAILPKLSVSIDRDDNRMISDSVWGTYGTVTTPGKYYIGPDDETIYNNSGWSVSLSWELGDLIWNESQTSIDTRSRLMVQLRGDILDEVTKLYFERLRVKLELDNISIEERKKRLEKELRLGELTASLDYFTGGYFSQAINTKGT